VLVFPPATADLVRRHVPPGARVLAVDAGAEACLAAGVAPEAVVGDMDSVRASTLEALAARGARVVRHPAAKRDTDGALALRLVEDAHVVFLGAGGGRPDHALANLHLMLAASRRARVEAVDADGRAWVVTPERPLALDLPDGAVVSVLPLTPRAEGVAYRNLRWGLDGAAMEMGDPYGMSNVAGPAPQEVRVAAGALLVLAPSQG
ncbi:MAG TPA: thiamine diphosphokinase, partial [Candidatus Thermoplasmatota archaeon]|nr:thiamine diphosphokinase [Candidatus Thermoplasmatota archaeon]